MSPHELHRWLVWGMFGLAAVTLIAVKVITAPYGRHAREGFGPTLPNRVGWILMECPAVLAFGAFFALGSQRAELVPLLFLGFWLLHYVPRAFVFPFRLRTAGKRMPLLVAMSGFTFNVFNAWLNARWISELGSYGADWLGDPRFALGALLFVAGWLINQHADHVLINLRPPGETGYRIPRGGLYRYVTCPNYLGELITWTGWAVMTWSLPGLAFAIYTLANLGPRAADNHRWYHEKFPDYPRERRALVPFVW